MSDDNLESNVADALSDLTKAVESAKELALVIDASEEEATSTELVAIKSEDPTAIKRRMSNVHSELVKAKKTVAEKRAVYENALRAQEQHARNMLAEMDAMLSPLVEKANRMKDGIAALNLYLGRGEYIEQIAEGKLAPKDSPIVIRQHVLAMDEESALFSKSGGMDAEALEEFDKWLTSDPAHVQQVIPEEKSVVAMVVRRKPKDYEDPWKAIALGEANSETWWFIRNGENLYRMATDFSVGLNLVPMSNEFTDLFNPLDRWTRTRTPLEPGTNEWLRAEKSADFRTRHFMKIALILQGLIERTAVFHPLPAENVSVIESRSYDAGHVKIISDAEFAIETAVKPFNTWLREINNKMDVGTRVILGKNYSTKDDPRISPKYASAPYTLTAYTINKQEGVNLYITYPRTDEIWSNADREYRRAKSSASWRVYKDDSHIIAVDYATVDEMERYLALRSQRHNYTEIFPVLKAAIAFKKEEAEKEAPFRALLESELDKMGSPESVDDLIHWFKSANKWARVLNGDQQYENKSAKLILAEAKRRLNTKSSESVVAKLRSENPDAIAILQSSTSYVVISPEGYYKPVKRADDKIFVRRTDVTKTGIIKRDDRWTVLTKSQVARMTLLHSTEVWDKWKVGFDKKGSIPLPRFEELVEQVKEISIANGVTPAAITVADYGTGWNTSTANITVWHKMNPIEIPEKPAISDAFPKLVSESTKFYVEWDGKEFELSKNRAGEIAGYLQDDQWRERHNTRISPERDSGTPLPPWGEGEQFWQDDNVIKADTAVASHWLEKKGEYYGVLSIADSLVSSIVSDWKSRQMKILHDEFMDDYGDDSLWDDHKKIQERKMEFPYGSAVQSGGYLGQTVNRKSLRWLTTRLVDEGLVPYGLTVAEALELAAANNVAGLELLDIPDEINELRFEEEKIESEEKGKEVELA